MCEYCDPESDRNEYWVDGLTGDWYHDVETSEWDYYDDDFVHIKEWGVGYCQYCGRDLTK